MFSSFEDAVYAVNGVLFRQLSQKMGDEDNLMAVSNIDVDVHQISGTAAVDGATDIHSLRHQTLIDDKERVERLQAQVEQFYTEVMGNPIPILPRSITYRR